MGLVLHLCCRVLSGCVYVCLVRTRKAVEPPHGLLSRVQCFRLYTRAFFDRQMPDVAAPEIQRTSLAGAVLYLKTLALDVDVLSFDFLDPPRREALEVRMLGSAGSGGLSTCLGFLWVFKHTCPWSEICYEGPFYIVFYSNLSRF